MASVNFDYNAHIPSDVSTIFYQETISQAQQIAQNGLEISNKQPQNLLSIASVNEIGFTGDKRAVKKLLKYMR